MRRLVAVLVLACGAACSGHKGPTVLLVIRDVPAAAMELTVRVSLLCGSPAPAASSCGALTTAPSLA